MKISDEFPEHVRERVEDAVARLRREPKVFAVPPMPISPPRRLRSSRGLVDALLMAAATTGSVGGLASILPRHDPTFPARTSEESRRAIAAAQAKRDKRAEKAMKRAKGER